MAHNPTQEPDGRTAAHDLLDALKALRRYVGDGDLSDGPRDRADWPLEFADLLDDIDALITRAQAAQRAAD